MTAKPLAYSYLRFSHPAQATGDSLRRQAELRDAWLARNHATLDIALNMEDKGISGYTGEHRSNPDRHALAAFVALVHKGRIAKGSYFIVESLDRLSREDIIPALSLLLDLIQSGIRVVQLLPIEAVYDAQSNPMMLMMAIMELSRGHSESAMKSERVGAAWQDKKRRAAETGEALTPVGPAWLHLVDGVWEIDRDAAATVHRIFRMAVLGYGIGQIAKRLNAEQVPVIGRAAYWATSYIHKILNNRAVLGEYQPYTGRGAKREKDGKPIAGYFPAIVTEAEWYAAHASMAARRNKVGRLPSERINVFNGLLYDSRDGGTMHLMNKGKKGGQRSIVGYKASQGVPGSKAVSFPFSTFEEAVLTCLREIDPAEVLPDHKAENKATELTGRMVEIEAEMVKLKTRLRAKYSDAVAEVLEEHEEEHGKLVEELNTASQEAASPLAAAWAEGHTLMDALKTAPNLEEALIRLRAILRRIVDSVWCLFVGRGATRLAAVQVYFAGGEHRDYVILHQPPKVNAAARTEGYWRARSLNDAVPLGELDLRKVKDVRKLETLLASVDLQELAKKM